MLSGSCDFPLLSLGTFPTISLAHLLKPCISKTYLYSISASHWQFACKKSGSEIISFDHVERNRSTVIWLPEALLRSFWLLTLILTPAPVWAHSSFSDKRFASSVLSDHGGGPQCWPIFIHCASTWALSIWKFMTTSFRIFPELFIQ